VDSGWNAQQDKNLLASSLADFQALQKADSVLDTLAFDKLEYNEYEHSINWV
jgi:hypothetical protein